MVVTVATDRLQDTVSVDSAGAGILSLLDERCRHSRHLHTQPLDSVWLHTQPLPTVLGTDCGENALSRRMLASPSFSFFLVLIIITSERAP